ncbi:caspase family protein [Flectobacillus roseus]
MRIFLYYTIFLLFSLEQLSTSVFAQSKGMKPVGGTAPAGTERRLALVIGNKDYTRPEARLKNPLNDANDVTAALQQLGFEVIKRTNLDRAGLETAIDDFTTKLTSYDVGLFYFSGHGMAFQGEYYLLPTDANLSFENQARSQCVSLRRVLDGMEGAQAKVNLVLLDACRNNPFKRSWGRSNGGNGLVIPNNPRGSMVAFATREGSIADDNVSENNGLFTSELLKYLPMPNLGLRDILDRTISGVEARSGGQQVPGRYDELRGDFIFVQTSKPVTDIVAIEIEKNFRFGYRSAKFGTPPTQLFNNLEWSALPLADEYKTAEVRYLWGKFTEPWVKDLLPEATTLSRCFNSSSYICFLFDKKGLFRISLRCMPDCIDRVNVLNDIAQKYGLNIQHRKADSHFLKETDNVVFFGRSDDTGTTIEIRRKQAPKYEGQDW